MEEGSKRSVGPRFNTPGSSEFNRGLNVKFQGKGKFVVEHVK